MTKDTGTHVSAPGRVILFGDHSINFGGPGIALAVEHRVHCRVKINSKFSVDGEDLDTQKHPYTRGAVLQSWTNMDKPLAIDFESNIPEGTGLGELAASTIACLGAISMIHNHLIYEDIAKNAFEIHHEVNKDETPLDISAATHGQGVYLSCHAEKNPLWTFQKENKECTIHNLDIPDMNLVLGYTGIPASEREMQAKILRFYQRNSFARDMITDLCQISAKGHEAFASGDLEETGRLMTQSHKLMMTLGAGHPMLDKLFQIATRHSYGAKLTGYGGGGSIIALTHEPERVISAIQEVGGKAWELEIASRGLRLED
jgi:mevalonate kinase